MKRFLSAIALLFMVCGISYAMELPVPIQDFINKEIPQTNFRFDGAVLLPDNTMYLPIFPSKEEPVSEIHIKATYPANTTLKQKPDMIIFNNKYCLLKVLNTKGKKTVINMTNPPDELQSGLLPQDILLPKGMIIPETLKGIIGDIDVSVAQETGLRITNPQYKPQRAYPVEQLEDKTFYIAPGINKNIQIVNPNATNPVYALAQNNVINDLKSYNDEFLLVTYFDSKDMDIISLMDEKVIKSVAFNTSPEQILIDKDKKIAYISSGGDSSIYVFNLETMTLKKQLKINGMCEKLTLSADGTKIFYVDRKTNDIWVIETEDNYHLRNIGSFPNISAIEFVNGKIYTISRTKNLLAIVDYETSQLITEIEVPQKPVALYVKDDDLYVLCAGDNIIEIIDTKTDDITDKLYLNTNAFATIISPIENSDLIMVTNARSGLYSVVDTQSKDIIKTSPLEVPVRAIAVTKRVKTIK